MWPFGGKFYQKEVQVPPEIFNGAAGNPVVKHQNQMPEKSFKSCCKTAIWKQWPTGVTQFSFTGNTVLRIIWCAETIWSSATVQTLIFTWCHELSLHEAFSHFSKKSNPSLNVHPHTESVTWPLSDWLHQRRQGFDCSLGLGLKQRWNLSKRRKLWQDWS